MTPTLREAVETLSDRIETDLRTSGPQLIARGALIELRAILAAHPDATPLTPAPERGALLTMTGASLETARHFARAAPSYERTRAAVADVLQELDAQLQENSRLRLRVAELEAEIADLRRSHPPGWRRVTIAPAQPGPANPDGPRSPVTHVWVREDEDESAARVARRRAHPRTGAGEM